jgi:hypothetical protein
MCVDQRELQIALDDVDYYRSEADRLPELERGRTDQVHRKANDECGATQCEDLKPMKFFRKIERSTKISSYAGTVLVSC